MNEPIWHIYDFCDTFRYVHFIGDTHVGHENFDAQGLKNLVKRIAKTNDKVVLMGDQIEMAIKNNMRISQELNTNNQMDYFLDLISPIKEQIIAVLRGNHEERIDTIDYTKAALMPHLPNAVYLGYEGFLRVSNGFGEPTLMYLHHGNGGSLNPEHFITNKIFKVGIQAIADIIAVGHIHQLWDNTYYIPKIVDLPIPHIAAKAVIAIRTGTFLKHPKYAAAGAYGINKTGSIRYDLNKRRIEYI